MVTERFYYTIEELYTDYLANGFNKLFIKWLGSYVDTTYTTNLYVDVENNYLNDVIVYIDIEHPDWEVVEKPSALDIDAKPELKNQIIKQMRKIKAWLDDSKYKYEKLIKLYTDNENKLMDQIKSESSTQFNDTPQTTIAGLDSDEFASTYTKNKTAIDSGTVMARLNELRASWSSLYDEWTKEFAKKFVYYI